MNGRACAVRVHTAAGHAFLVGVGAQTRRIVRIPLLTQRQTVPARIALAVVKRVAVRIGQLVRLCWAVMALTSENS